MDDLKQWCKDNICICLIVLLVLVILALALGGWNLMKSRSDKKDKFAAAGRWATHPSGKAHNLAVLSSSEYDSNPHGANKYNQIDSMSGGRQVPTFRQFDMSLYNDNMNRRLNREDGEAASMNSETGYQSEEDASKYQSMIQKEQEESFASADARLFQALGH